MRRLNPPQAGSCRIMSISSSPFSAAVSWEGQPRSAPFADSCDNTAATEWQRRPSAASTRHAASYESARFRRLLADCSRPVAVIRVCGPNDRFVELSLLVLAKEADSAERPTGSLCETAGRVPLPGRSGPPSVRFEHGEAP